MTEVTVDADGNVALAEKKPFDVHCGNCGHEWVPFFTPIALDRKGISVMRNAAKACPRCLAAKVFCGKRPISTNAKED